MVPARRIPSQVSTLSVSDQPVSGRMSRAVRLARGSAAAVMAILFAALGHTAGHPAGTSGAPGSLAMMVGLLIAVPLCVALAGRPLSLAHTAGGVILSQAAFHTLFAFFGAADVFAAGASTATHAHGSNAVALDATTAAGFTADTGMWLAHVVAAVATIVVLRRGEAVAATLLSFATRFVTRLRELFLAPQPTGAGIRVSAHSPLLVAIRRPFSTPQLRGPPVGACAI